MNTLQLIRDLGPLALLAIAALWVLRAFLSDLGRSLWAASTSAVKGLIALALVLGAFWCAADAVILVSTAPVDTANAVRLLAVALALFGLAAGLVLHALLRWLDLIARIQRGDHGSSDKKSISLFS